MTYPGKVGSGGVRIEPDIAPIGALFGEPARARAMLALLGDRTLSAGALAAEAGVGAATMSAHLTKLVDAGLLTVERRGRSRYFRLAGPEVADVLAALARIAPGRPNRSLRQTARMTALRRARTCYDHVGGLLGVALMTTLLRGGYITGLQTPDKDCDRGESLARITEYRITAVGRHLLASLGIDTAQFSPRRPHVSACRDWSEDGVHVAGALGAALTSRMIAQTWIRPDPHSRIVYITQQGRAGLNTLLEVPLDFDRALALTGGPRG